VIGKFLVEDTVGIGSPTWPLES